MLPLNCHVLPDYAANWLIKTDDPLLCGDEFSNRRRHAVVGRRKKPLDAING